MFEANQAFSAFDGLRLLVVGDLMLDQYTWGQVERISPEAPVMVLEAQEEEVRLGGAVNGDCSVRRLKGDGRPVIDQTKRAAMVAALEAVDRVVILQADDPCALLRELRPEVLVKGGGYRPDQVVGREIVEAYGGEIRLVEHVPGISTTQIMESLHAS